MDKEKELDGSLLSFLLAGMMTWKFSSLYASVELAFLMNNLLLSLRNLKT